MSLNYCSGNQTENNKIDEACSTYGGRGQVYTGFWWEILREKYYLEVSGVNGKIILRRILRKRYVGVWTGWSWLRIRTCGGRL
jgi:hypothetical protein